MEKSAQKRRTKAPTRRTFDVKGQLVGKLGPRGYGTLLDQLREVTVPEPEAPKPKRRRRRRLRKAVV